jgi:hypothetical protein
MVVRLYSKENFHVCDGISVINIKLFLHTMHLYSAICVCFLTYVSYEVYINFLREKILLALKRPSHSASNNIYFKMNYPIRVIYVPTYTCVARHLLPLCNASTHWLPTLLYTLCYILATPKNATHTKCVGRGASNKRIHALL